MNDAMLAADECEEHFTLLCKLIRAISKKPYPFPPPPALTPCAAHSYATYPAKERLQRHSDERAERELLIKAYKAKKRGKPLNSEEENELDGIYVSDLTTTPSSYSSSPTTETDTTETELSPENEQQKIERMFCRYREIMRESLNDMPTDVIEISPVFCFFFSILITLYNMHLCLEEKEYIKGVKVKEKQMKKMMKLYTTAVKKEDPERFYIPETMVGKGYHFFGFIFCWIVI